MIAFVGKEAYRGAFGERPELGLQTRSLGDTALFVLPSTSPANAAVPYAERLRWFASLKAWLDTPRVREAVCGVVLDTNDRVLLTRGSSRTGRSCGRRPAAGSSRASRTSTPSAGARGGDRARRLELGPLVWPRLQDWEDFNPWWDDQRERTYLVRVPPFEPAPRLTAGALAAEFVFELRWWSVEELVSSGVGFAPTSRPELVAGLAREGAPAAPIDVG